MNETDYAQFYGQKGLSYLPPYAIFATLYLKPAAIRAGESNNTYRALKNLMRRIDDRIQQIPGADDDQASDGDIRAPISQCRSLRRQPGSLGNLVSPSGHAPAAWV